MTRTIYIYGVYTEVVAGYSSNIWSNLAFIHVVLVDLIRESIDLACNVKTLEQSVPYRQSVERLCLGVDIKLRNEENRSFTMVTMVTMGGDLQPENRRRHLAFHARTHMHIH